MPGMLRSDELKIAEHLPSKGTFFMDAHAVPVFAPYRNAVAALGADACRLGRTAWAKSASARERVILMARATSQIAKQAFAILLRLASDGLVLANFLHDSFSLITLTSFGLDLLNPTSIGLRALALLAASMYAISASIHYHVLAIPFESRTLAHHAFEFYAFVLIVL